MQSITHLSREGAARERDWTRGRLAHRRECVFHQNTGSSLYSKDVFEALLKDLHDLIARLHRVQNKDARSKRITEIVKIMMSIKVLSSGTSFIEKLRHIPVQAGGWRNTNIPLAG